MTSIKVMWNDLVHRLTPQKVKQGDTIVLRAECVEREAKALEQLMRQKPQNPH